MRVIVKGLFDNIAFYEMICRGINSLGKYEDLKAERRLVILPCPIGDTVYWIDGDNDNEIVELTVIEFRYDLNDRLICRAEYADKTDYVDLFDFEFGRTVFLNREDAEAAVKGAER